MEPTFNACDRVRVNQIIYKLKKPKIGDVIVLKDPRTKRLILKRIQKINSDGYFVKGDNSSESTDSREFGAVSVNDIIGRVSKGRKES